MQILILRHGEPDYDRDCLTENGREQAMAAALPRLEIALAEHAPAFRHVEVALVAKKGRTDEVA